MDVDVDPTPSGGRPSWLVRTPDIDTLPKLLLRGRAAAWPWPGRAGLLWTLMAARRLASKSESG
jgi:hypothetical protein